MGDESHGPGNVPGEHEDPGEDITTPDVPLSPGTVEKLADEHGIVLPDWTPTVPNRNAASIRCPDPSSSGASCE